MAPVAPRPCAGPPLRHTRLAKLPLVTAPEVGVRVDDGPMAKLGPKTRGECGRRSSLHELCADACVYLCMRSQLACSRACATSACHTPVACMCRELVAGRESLASPWNLRAVAEWRPDSPPTECRQEACQQHTPTACQPRPPTRPPRNRAARPPAHSPARYGPARPRRAGRSGGAASTTPGRRLLLGCSDQDLRAWNAPPDAVSDRIPRDSPPANPPATPSTRLPLA